MKKSSIKTKCPVCKSQIDIAIDELLVNSIRADVELELAVKHAEIESDKESFLKLSKEFEKEKIEFENLKTNFNSLIDSQVDEKLKEKERKLKEEIKKQVDDERASIINSLEEELRQKTARIIDQGKLKADMERMKRDAEAMETDISIKYEKILTQKLSDAKLSIAEQEQEKASLALEAKQMTIDNLQKKLNEARVQIESGMSQRVQGELQEIALELQLKDAFSNFGDTIEEIKKFKKGMDCIQHINVGHEKTTIAKIGYESKNILSNKISSSWVPKLKQDLLEHGCDLGVIVVNKLPEGTNEKFLLQDGIFIVPKNFVCEWATLMRYSLLKIHSVKISHKGKDEKSEKLFQYICSESFAQTFNSILDAFASIRDAHATEKLRIQKLWIQKEQALETLIGHIITHYGTLRSISEAVPVIEHLELPLAS